MIVPSGLCVGLDPDLARLPSQYRGTAADIVPFLAEIITATRPYAAAFKINTAFFEQYGHQGMDALYGVREAVGSTFCIIDAKRGDIGNTSAAYARSLFDDLTADAITVAPYMGSDSIEPFLAYENKLVYILALTSNPGSADFQRLDVHGEPLYRRVMHTALQWKGASHRGFVVGATHTTELAHLRSAFPEVPFLIPGVGAQGGDPHEISLANAGGPALINSSRGILYAHDGEDFAIHAARVAQHLQLSLT